MTLVKPHRLIQIAFLLMAPAAAVTAGGLVSHEDGLVLDVTRDLPPPGTGDPAFVRVSIRNRLPFILPVRGSRFAPAWFLERRTRDGRWQPIPAKSSRPPTL